MLTALAEALPKSWALDVGEAEGRGRQVLRITSPAGECAAFDIVHGRSGVVPASDLTTPISLGSSGLIYLAAYLSAPLRAKLEAAGISYADATGWVRLAADEPMLAVSAQGAAKAPRELTPGAVTRLSGRSAGRLIRTLVGSAPPVGVRELALLANVSPGTVSKVLPTLVADGSVVRDAGGRVVAVSPRELLKRWTIDYGVLKSNGRPFYYLAPRGIDSALKALKARRDLAFTGSCAASGWLPPGTEATLPTMQLVAYARDPITVASDVGLMPVDPQAANIILLTPQDPTILGAPPLCDDMPLAPLPLVLADLMTLPGRYPQQAEALMDACAKSDPVWRP